MIYKSQNHRPMITKYLTNMVRQSTQG